MRWISKMEQKKQRTFGIPGGIDKLGAVEDLA